MDKILPPQLDIYRASAGSGKTFLLAKQYLKLLLKKPLNHRNILAVTFTNKATAEMKHRILIELKNLADGKETPYAKTLLHEVKGLSTLRLTALAKEAYTNILHDYSRFAISTIDSFVQKIIRSFAYEIGLDAGFTLQLDTSLVKEDLAQRLYQLLDTDKSLLSWVVDMASQRLGEGKNWDFKKDMLELAAELFKERYQLFSQAMQAIPESKKNETFQQFREQVFSIKKNYENTLATMAKEAIATIEEAGLCTEDFSYGKSSFANYFNKLSQKKMEEPGQRVADTLSGKLKMYPKVSKPETIAAIESVADSLTHILQKIMDYQAKNQTNYFTAKSISGNLYTLQLMEVFNNQLGNYRSDNNALLISDTHLLLRKLTAETEASFIFEKTGNRYQHFLIDEFQDTSNFQWDNFKPLMENSLSQANYNLIVGDVKQAIYRWRNGDWRLLLAQVKSQLQHFNTNNETLKENYRSSKNIIDFNNYFFATLPILLQEKFNTQMKEAPSHIFEKLEINNYTHIIAEAYSDSFQETPKSSVDGGFAAIRFFETATNEDGEKISFDEMAMQELPLEIERLIKEKKYKPSDIGILTRGNSEAKKVVETLMQFQHQEGTERYAVMSAEALMIHSNEGVQMLLAAMKFLVNEKDLLSRSFLVQTIARQHGTIIPMHHWYASNGHGKELLPIEFLKQKETLKHLPLLDLVSKLIEIFGLGNMPEHQNYLLAFQDLILEQNRFGEEGLQSFFNYWNEEGIKKSLPATEAGNAVEVLTIHKSKGLAFSVVILPFCNWDLEPNTSLNNWLWVGTENTPFPNMPVVPVKHNKDLAKSHFAYEYFEEQLLSQMDALNLLYVAFTRAKYRIVAYAPLPKKPEKETEQIKIKTIGDLIFSGLDKKLAPKSKECVPVFEAFDGDELFFGDEAEMPTNTTFQQESGLKIEALNNKDWCQQIAVRPAKNTISNIEEDDLQLPRKQGSLLHEALALLQQPDEIKNVFQQLKWKGVIGENAKIEMEKILQPMLLNPIFDGWKKQEMKRLGEREILTKNGDFRRPDLVLFNMEKTWVIDFKFGEKKDHAHQRQVAEYMALLQQMNFAGIKGFLFYSQGFEVVEVIS